jgi:hypothetical protein
LSGRDLTFNWANAPGSLDEAQVQLATFDIAAARILINGNNTWHAMSWCVPAG